MVNKPAYAKNIENEHDLVSFNEQLGRIMPGFMVNLLSPGRVRSERDAILIPYGDLVLCYQDQDIELGAQDLVRVPNSLEDLIIKDGRTLSLVGNDMAKEFEVVYARDIKKEPGIGGVRKMLQGFNHEGNADIHLIWVDDDNVKIPHYHMILVELYFVLEGEGKINIERNHEGEIWSDNNPLDLKPRTLVGVPTLYTHQAVHNPGENMLIQVIGLPKFYPDDVYRVG